MMHAYGVDVLAPGLSMRRFWVLWNRLPPSTRVRADVEDSWSQESYLLAAAVDWLAHLDYVTRQMWSKKKLDPPKPVDRPASRAARAPGVAPVTPWRDLLRKLGSGR